MSLFSIGQTVYRKEDRPDVEATVREIDDEDGKKTYLIDYVEGGSGWWPEHTLSVTHP